MNHIEKLNELSKQLDERLAADPKWIRDDRTALIALAEIIAAWLALYDELESDLAARYADLAAQLTAKKDELLQGLDAEAAAAVQAALDAGKAAALAEIEAAKDTALAELDAGKAADIAEAKAEIDTYVEQNKANLKGDKGDKGDKGTDGGEYFIRLWKEGTAYNAGDIVAVPVWNYQGGYDVAQIWFFVSLYDNNTNPPFSNITSNYFGSVWVRDNDPYPYSLQHSCDSKWQEVKQSGLFIGDWITVKSTIHGTKLVAAKNFLDVKFRDDNWNELIKDGDIYATGNITGAKGTFTGDVSGANFSGAKGTFTGDVSGANFSGAKGTFTGDVSGANLILNGDTIKTTSNTISIYSAEYNLPYKPITYSCSLGQVSGLVLKDLHNDHTHVYLSQDVFDLKLNMLALKAENNVFSITSYWDSTGITGTHRFSRMFKFDNTGTYTTSTATNATGNEIATADWVNAKIATLQTTITALEARIAALEAKG